MQSHRYSFFGQKVGLILKADDWADPWFFLTFIKKRGDGTWEKLAEGRTIKVSLPEIAQLQAVVRGERAEWKAYHKANGEGVDIHARREAGNSGKVTIVLAVGGYVKPVEEGELAIFQALLDHLFAEKIANATVPNSGGRDIETLAEDEALVQEGIPAKVVEPPASKARASNGAPHAKVTRGGPRTAKPDLFAPAGNSGSSEYSEDDEGVPSRANNVKRVTEKAICVVNSAGNELWVPKKALAGTQPIDAPRDSPWDFTLKAWFARKVDVTEWLSGG